MTVAVEREGNSEGTPKLECGGKCESTQSLDNGVEKVRVHHVWIMLRKKEIVAIVWRRESGRRK